MNHRPLNVVQVRVMLQRPLQEAGLLAELGHVGAVIVGEHLIPQDGICNLQNKTHIPSLPETSGLLKAFMNRWVKMGKKLSNKRKNKREIDDKLHSKKNLCVSSSPHDLFSVSVPVERGPDSFPAGGSAAVLPWVCCSSEHPVGRMCTAGSGCTP